MSCYADGVKKAEEVLGKAHTNTAFAHAQLANCQLKFLRKEGLGLLPALYKLGPLFTMGASWTLASFRLFWAA